MQQRKPESTELHFAAMQNSKFSSELKTNAFVL